MLNDNWNELQFLSWKEFKSMAPSILQLEVTRLGKVLHNQVDNTEFYNSVVRARFNLSQFIDSIKATDIEELDDESMAHLRNAIMSMSVQPEDLDKESTHICGYVLDRLNYVHYRINLLY